MKTKSFLLAAAVLSAATLAHGQGTAFIYQGRLGDGANPATGIYDLQFAIYDSTNQPGNVIAGPVTNAATSVSNGLFTAMLDFGTNVFTGADRWLEIAVRSNGVAALTTLAPRQKLTPAPYAVYAGNVNAAGIAGSIADSQLSANIARLSSNLVFTGAVQFSNPADSFTGDAAGLTNLSVSSFEGTIVNSMIVAWGDNTYGETSVPANLTNVTAAAAGYGHALAIRSDRTLAAWGNNQYGQINIPADLSNIIAVAAGAFHSLALKSDGTVYAWGDNSSGQTNIPFLLTSVVAIAAGESHSLALKANGTVVGWGDNTFGQINVPAGLSNVVAIAGGGNFSLALKSNGTVTAWGDNSFTQINVPANLSNVVAIAAGYDHSLALRSDGTVIGWGTNHFGDLTIPPGLNGVIGIAAGDRHSIALKNDGTVVAWGNNSFGETLVPPTARNVTALAPGCEAYYVLAIRPRILSRVVLADQSNTFYGDNVFNGRVGINTAPQQPLHINAVSGYGEGMEIDSDSSGSGHTPAIYLNHTGLGGRNFRIASFADGFHPAEFVIRDETAGADRLTIDPAGVISGNGSGLTGVAVLNADQSFTGANQFLNGLTISNTVLAGGVTLRAGGNPSAFYITDNTGERAAFALATGTGNYSSSAVAGDVVVRALTGRLFLLSGSGAAALTVSANNNVGIATAAPAHLLQVGNSGSPPYCDGTTWVNGSDRNAKAGFQPVNPAEILARLTLLPLSTWHYTNDPGTPHIGPMAQDFQAAFGVGADNRHIATVDADGVALAAIQGLNEKVEAGRRKSEARIQELEGENAELKRRLEALEKFMRNVELK